MIVCPYSDPTLREWWPLQTRLFQEHAARWTKLFNRDALDMVCALTDCVGFRRELLSLVSLLRHRLRGAL